MRSNIPSRYPSTTNDTIISTQRLGYDTLIHCVLSFAGHLDQDRMKKAIRLTYDAEPILGCKYIEHWSKPFWQRRSDIDQLALLTISEEADVDQAVREYITTPIDLSGDPLIQAKIIRAKQDTLCIKANHIATDAGGLKAYIELLGNIYKQLDINPDYKPKPNLNGERGLDQVLRRFSLLSKLKMVRRSFRNWKSDAFPESNWELPMQMAPPSGRTFAIRKISRDQFNALKKYGDRHGVTLNDIFISAFYRALHPVMKSADSTPFRLFHTVDLRRYLPSGRASAICNLVGVFQLNIGPTLGEKFADTLSYVHNTMTELKKDNLGLYFSHFTLFGIPFLPFSILKKILTSPLIGLLRLGPKRFPPLLTNMGLISEKSVDFGSIKVTDAFLTAPLAYPPIFVIGLSGFNQTMTISIGYCGSSIEHSLVNQLLDNVEYELTSISNNNACKQ